MPLIGARHMGSPAIVLIRRRFWWDTLAAFTRAVADIPTAHPTLATRQATHPSPPPVAITDEESCLWHWAAAVHGIHPCSNTSNLRNGSHTSFHSEVDQPVYHPSSLFSSGFIVVRGLYQRQKTLGDPLLVIRSTAPFFNLEGCSQLPKN